MKLLIVLSLLAIASAAVFKMGLERKRNPLPRQNPLRANRHFNPKRKATGSQGLTNRYGDYVANITIGSPPQQFRMEMRTWEADFVVFDSSCSQCGFDEKVNKFDSSKSSTYVKDGRPIKDISDVKGFLGRDTMSFGSIGDQQIAVRGQIFGQITEPTHAIFRTRDGYLGLGLPAVASEGFVPPLFNAINQGALDEPIFTMWLMDTKEQYDVFGGQITYGGLDTDHCGDVIAYHPLSLAAGWQFRMKSVATAGYSATGGWDAKVRFDAPDFMGPKVVIDELVVALGGKVIEYGDLYPIECDAKLEPIVFGIGSYKYPIDSSLLIYEEDPGECYLNLVGTEYAPFAPVWEFGYSFAFQYCQIFDLGQQRVGFAPAVKE